MDNYISDEGDDGDAHPSTFPCANFLRDAGILEDFLLLVDRVGLTMKGHGCRLEEGVNRRFKTFTSGDEGMTNGSPIFAYLVFGPGRVSLERLLKPIKAAV
jgi:hypothetical protein